MKDVEYTVSREDGYWILRREGSNMTIKTKRAQDWKNFLEALGDTVSE